VKEIRIFVLVLSLLFFQYNSTFANEAVLRKVLKNGLTVLAKDSAPKDLVTIDIIVRAAPLYEEEYLGSGISHFVEHMLFKGTAARKSGDIDKEVRSYGGLIDGSVSSDFTSYQITVPTKYFPQALALLKDMLLNAAFDPAEMEKEREVILKEVNLNEDDPEKQLILSLFFNSYIRHPYRYPGIGYEDLLRGLARSDLIKYYNNRYVPNNMFITIVGGINDLDAVSRVEKEFKDFRKPSYGVPGTDIQEPPQLGKKIVQKSASTNLSYLAIGFHSTGILNKDLFAMDVLSMILGRGNNSRLNRALVEDKRIAHSVSASNYTPEGPGLFIITAIADKDNIEPSQKLILEEIKKIKSNEVTDKELETAKKMVQSDYVLSRETIGEQARDLCENEIMTGNYDFSSRYIEGVKRVKKSDIRKAAERYLSDENMTEVTLFPKDDTQLSNIDVPKPLTEEKIEKRELANGLVVLTRRSAKIPAVAITIAFSGGLLEEDKNNNGISSFVARMLLDGTKTRAESDIRGAIESHGGEIATFSGFNSFGINITVLKDDLDLALEIAKDIISDSVFPQEEITKEKMLAIATIKEEDDDIFQKGVYLLKKDLFENHPYAMRTSGEMQTVSSLKLDELINFYHTYCVPNNMVISVSGAIDTKKVFQKLESLFKDMTRASLPKRPSLEIPKDELKKKSFKMDKDQTLLMVGFKTVGINNPDKYPLDVLDTLLSGMSGRLFASIREKSAVSYTLGCVQKLGIDTGFMLFYVATTKNKLELTKEKLFNEIKLIRDTVVTDEELDSAKTEMLSGYKMLMQTNTAYSFQSALDELCALGYDNLYKYEDQIKKVTKLDIKRVADKYLNLNAYTEVIVGPE
jgi:zinc protease